MPRRIRRLSLVLLSGLIILSSACEVAPPTTQRRPQTRPADSGPTTTTSQPATQPTTTQATATQPATAEAAPAEPEIPDYVTIIERYNPQQRASVTVRPEVAAATNRLSIDTRNVRRLHIDRDRIPLNRRRSVSLQLDGQGLEWLASSQVEEFERSVNGVWIPVKSEARGRP